MRPNQRLEHPQPSAGRRVSPRHEIAGLWGPRCADPMNVLWEGALNSRHAVSGRLSFLIPFVVALSVGCGVENTVDANEEMS